jgi:hypothetical protein
MYILDLLESRDPDCWDLWCPVEYSYVFLSEAIYILRWVVIETKNVEQS